MSDSSLKDYIEVSHSNLKKAEKFLKEYSLSQLAEKKNLQIKIETSLKSVDSNISKNKGRI